MDDNARPTTTFAATPTQSPTPMPAKDRHVNTSTHVNGYQQHVNISSTTNGGHVDASNQR
jgi:hypothetical protein